MVRCLLNLDLGARWLHSYVALISISLLGSITTTTRWMSTWTRSPARAARPAPCPTLGASGHCGCGCAGCMPICGERRVSGCGGRYSGAHRSIDHVPRASLVGNVLALVVREETLLLRKVALWREIRRVMQPRVPHGRDLGRVKVLVGVLDPAIATCAHAHARAIRQHHRRSQRLSKSAAHIPNIPLSFSKYLCASSAPS